jgi:hypothetical protein
VPDSNCPTVPRRAPRITAAVLLLSSKRLRRVGGGKAPVDNSYEPFQNTGGLRQRTHHGLQRIPGGCGRMSSPDANNARPTPRSTQEVDACRR